MAYPLAIDPPTAVSVLTTTTVLATFDVRNTETLTVEVANTDATSTMACVIQRQATTSSSFVDSTLPDLSSIAPGSSAAVDIDVAANASIRIIGTATPATATGTVCGRDKPRGRR